jgi:hypothetical protein
MFFIADTESQEDSETEEMLGNLLFLDWDEKL